LKGDPGGTDSRWGGGAGDDRCGVGGGFETISVSRGLLGLPLDSRKVVMLEAVSFEGTASGLFLIRELSDLSDLEWNSLPPPRGASCLSISIPADLLVAVPGWLIGIAGLPLETLTLLKASVRKWFSPTSSWGGAAYFTTVGGNVDSIQGASGICVVGSPVTWLLDLLPKAELFPDKPPASKYPDDLNKKSSLGEEEAALKGFEEASDQGGGGGNVTLSKEPVRRSIPPGVHWNGLCSSVSIRDCLEVLLLLTTLFWCDVNEADCCGKLCTADELTKKYSGVGGGVRGCVSLTKV
jgi:hypothetical protein